MKKTKPQNKLPINQPYLNHYSPQVLTSSLTSTNLSSNTGSPTGKNNVQKAINQLYLKSHRCPESPSNLRTRSQEITFTRLRIGHTRSHFQLHASFLPSRNIDFPLTVDHIFDCPNLASLGGSYNIPQDRASVLGDHVSAPSDIFLYLHRIGFLTPI